MKYTYIELNEYKRFALNEITHFSAHINSTLLLILGTNGSGKSSLMGELSVLPPSASDFGKTGSKVVKVEHNHNIYTLSAKFGTSKPFSFKLNDEELNEDGLVTTQRALVYKHFKINAEVFELITGREKFTEMKAPRRKEWLLKLCDTSYDYALRVYNKLREQQRDVSGAIKIAKKTLVQESEKLIIDEELTRMRQEIEGYHKALNELLEIRKPAEHDLGELAIKQGRLDDTLLEAARALEFVRSKTDGIPRNVGDYDELIAAAHEDLVRASAVSESLAVAYNKNNEKIRVLEKADKESMSSLLSFLSEAKDKQAVLLQTLILKPGGISNPSDALTRFVAIKNTLAVIFSEIPVNEDKKYSQVKLHEAVEQEGALRTTIAALSDRLHKLDALIKHQESHKNNPDLQCPNCDHRFSAEYKPAVHAGFVAEYKEATESLEKAKSRLDNLNVYMTECREYAANYRQFMTLGQNNPDLRGYFAWLAEQGYLTHMPRSGTNALNLIEKDLSTLVDIELLATKIKEKEELLTSLQNVGSADLQTLVKQNDELSEQMGQQAAAMQSAQGMKSMYQQEQALLRRREELLGRVRNIIASKKTVSLDVRETMKRLALNDLIRQLQSELAVREQRVGAASLQKEIVTNLSKQIETLRAKELDYGILIKHLSPTEGLIAEGLIGFIKNFIDAMNNIIRQVWSYSMVIQSCEMEDGASLDLDYKFPVQINELESPIPDVANGSTGMCEIINLAFVLTAMYYLGMQDVPLYLDEFGGPLDQAHKASAIRVIENLMEQLSFPQLFLISHDYHQYSALSNAEVIMLNKLNVAPPSGININEFVTMH